MKKLFSLVCAVFMTVMTFGASYGILVNGKTYFAGEAAGEYEGFSQYLAHVSLKAGDFCQLYDAENKASWAVTLNQWSEEGFTLNKDRYEVSVTGCFDFYIKLKFEADELYIGNGSDCGEGEDISGGGDDPIVPPVVDEAFFLKNNWDGGEWRWEAMSKDEADGLWKLEHVFGGAGVNLNSKADDEGAAWFALEDIAGGDKIQKSDTVRFIYDAQAKALSVELIGRPSSSPEPPVVDAHHFLKNNWANGEWEWKEMVEDEGSWVLAEVVIGDGGGVNFATAISDDAPWIEYKNIPAWLQTGEETLLEALDTVVFIFDPEEVNAYDPDKGHGLFAWVLAKHQSGGDTPEPPVVDEAFFLKNNWNGGEAWTWEAMSKDEADGLWKLEHVFGGTGVNLNSKAEEEGAEWFPLEKIAGDEIQALDTVRFIYDSKEKVLSAVLLGRPSSSPEPPVVDAHHFLKNNWDNGEWAWKEMVEDEGSWVLAEVVIGDGGGVNFATAISDDAPWIEYKNIPAWLQTGEETLLEALDTVVFIFDPEEVNAYDPDKGHGLFAWVLAKHQSGGDTPEPPVVDESFFLKNNWNGGEAWTWEAMSKDEADGLWKLEHVFGGTGVNLNTKAEEEGAEWFPLEKIAGDEIQALDTVRFIYDSKEKVLAAKLIGRPSGTPEPPVVDEHHFLKNNWANGEWEWKEMIQADEDTWSLAEVVIGDGGGVNFATAISDDAPWIEYKNIQAWLLNGDEAQLEALDTVTFIFTPSEVNAYDRERGHGLFAIILAKHAGAPEPPVSDEHHFLKNNWANGEWAWKEMVQKDEDTWLLQNVVIGDGGGVNFATEISDDAPWIEYKNISAWLMNGEEAQLEALDTVIFVFTPSEVNAYDPEKGHGLFAMIVGKHGAASIEPEIPNGFYIVGSFNNWTPSAEYALLPNPNAPEGVEEYMVSTVLQEGDELKGLAVYNGMYFYYPEGDNIVVPAEYAGKCTLYFRPNGNDEWPWKFIYIVVEQEQGLNTINASDKAVKMMHNGQLFILKGGKTYNVLGTLVK